MNKILLLMLICLVAFGLAACGTFSVSADAVSVADATATAQAEAPSTPAAVENTPVPEIGEVITGTVTPEPEPAAALPAPLYYLNPDDNQVWRVEPDGVTLTQVSQEIAPVEQYDVNPVDGSLVLLSHNSLILTDGLGGERRVIVSGRSEAEVGVHWYLTDRITNPVWSEDGQQLAYGLNGINFYEITSGTSRVVLPNDQMPEDEARAQRPILLYTPNSFSPDGTFLLLTVGWYQAGGGGPAVLRLNTAAPLVELQGEGFPCCTFRWTQDGSAILSANHTFGMFQPGLWRSDAATGETETLIAGDTGEDEVRVFNWPQDLGNGQIAVFYGEGPRATHEQGLPSAMSLVTVDAQTGTVTEQRAGEWMPGEATWLPDGSGVALTDTGGQTGQLWPPTGTLTYLSLAGEEVELPAHAHLLRWGVVSQ